MEVSEDDVACVSCEEREEADAERPADVAGARQIIIYKKNDAYLLSR